VINSVVGSTTVDGELMIFWRTVYPLKQSEWSSRNLVKNCGRHQKNYTTLKLKANIVVLTIFSISLPITEISNKNQD